MTTYCDATCPMKHGWSRRSIATALDEGRTVPGLYPLSPLVVEARMRSAVNIQHRGARVTQASQASRRAIAAMNEAARTATMAVAALEAEQRELERLRRVEAGLADLSSGCRPGGVAALEDQTDS